MRSRSPFLGALAGVVIVSAIFLIAILTGIGIGTLRHLHRL